VALIRLFSAAADTGVSHVHIHFLLMNAYSMGGTIRTTLNTAAALALRHDIEVVSLYRRRETARFDAAPAVRVRALSDQVPPDGEAAAYPYGRCTGVAEGLRRVPSVLVPPSERRYRNFSLLTDLKLAAFLRGLDDGVLVSTRPGLNLAAARLAPTGTVRVGQEHMYLDNHPLRLRRRIARAYRRLDAVSALTERDAEDYRRLLGGSTRVVRMPNAAPRTALRSTGDREVVVAAGRLVRQKGFDLLVDAWVEVARRHPRWELHVYGAGPEKDALTAQVHRLGLDGRVRLMGYTDDLLAKMAGASAYVLSSRSEGFPLVLLEAMAVGLPVVSFDCRNGPRDIVRHARDGLMVPAGDVTALAEAVSSLLADPARRRRMGRAAVERAHDHDLQAICARWEELFAELLDEKTRRSRGG
jgi:glycosyltransferase involved in cell wall biosynthesis